MEGSYRGGTREMKKFMYVEKENETRIMEYDHLVRCEELRDCNFGILYGESIEKVIKVYISLPVTIVKTLEELIK